MCDAGRVEPSPPPAPTTVVTLPDGRRLAADDVGERGLDCALAKLNRRREALRRDLAAVERVIADLRRDLPEDLQSRRRSV